MGLCFRKCFGLKTLSRAPCRTQQKGGPVQSGFTDLTKSSNGTLPETVHLPRREMLRLLPSPDDDFMTPAGHFGCTVPPGSCGPQSLHVTASFTLELQV